MDNQQCNDEGLRELALFAGAGGGILGGRLLGWRTGCAVEYNAYARSVLLTRQNDGTLPPFPIWDDVRTFDGTPWRGIVDVVSGGFPCQDISAAGKGAGIDGERSGLWGEMARIIGEVQPRFVFVENSPMLTNRGLGKVLGDLAEMGFDAEWGCISAADVGANHERERIWILATNTSDNWDRWWKQQQEGFQKKDTNDSHTNMPQRERRSISERVRTTYAKPSGCDWWENLPEFYRMDDGVAHRLDRLKAIGNGQVPLSAATAWKILNAN
jgi:DNA (cytosine-5)-methyltransferase 1